MPEFLCFIFAESEIGLVCPSVNDEAPSALDREEARRGSFSTLRDPAVSGRGAAMADSIVVVQMSRYPDIHEV